MLPRLGSLALTLRSPRRISAPFRRQLQAAPSTATTPISYWDEGGEAPRPT